MDLLLTEKDNLAVPSCIWAWSQHHLPGGAGESFTEGFSRGASRPALGCTRMLLLRLMLSERLVSMRPLSSTIRQYRVTFRASLCANPFWLPAQGQHCETVFSSQGAISGPIIRGLAGLLHTISISLWNDIACDSLQLKHLLLRSWREEGWRFSWRPLATHLWGRGSPLQAAGCSRSPCGWCGSHGLLLTAVTPSPSQ